MRLGDDDRPGPRSRLSNPDSKVSLAAMIDGVELGFRFSEAENVSAIASDGRVDLAVLLVILFVVMPLSPPISI